MRMTVQYWTVDLLYRKEPIYTNYLLLIYCELTIGSKLRSVDEVFQTNKKKVRT